MGVELVEGRDLLCRDQHVYMRTTAGEQRVDVVYRRVDDDFLDPVHFRPDSVLGCAGILNAARAGNVTIANAPGNGVADDKAVYPYVPAMIEYYLGEVPILANVETYRLEDPEVCAWVLDRLDQLVFKPVDGSGGKGIVIGPADERGRGHGRRTLRLATAYAAGSLGLRKLTLKVVADNAELSERLKFLQNAVGAIQGPFDSFLALRGLKTLALRMERHCTSGLKVAAWLERHPKVRRVFYPGLASHPQHALAKKQMHGFGGMISAELEGTLDDARRFLERCQLFALAESLGGVESLIEHPALMTHGSVPADVRATLGIGDTLVRLSVGIEDPDDLIADLAAALG
jgi:hypothetical protein